MLYFFVLKVRAAVSTPMNALKVQCLKVFCYNGNKSTILLFNSSFRTTPEISTKLYFAEISEVLEKLWLFNHKTVDFLASKFWIFFSLFSLLNL